MTLLAAHVHWVVTAIGVAFALAGALLAYITYLAIRTGETRIYSSTVTLRNDPFSYILNTAFSLVASFACFYCAALIFSAEPPKPDTIAPAAPTRATATQR